MFGKGSRFLIISMTLMVLFSCAVAGENEEFDAHEAYIRLHFDDNEMEFAFTLIVGATGNHGCEIGEAFVVASNIEEGNPESWHTEWVKMAQRVQERGEKALAGGHEISAKNQFLRASYYYRAALVGMLPDDPRFRETADKSRRMLLDAGELMDPPLEYFELPFEGIVLPGVYWRAANDDTPRKTLLMIGGGETFAEDLFFYSADQAHERGYNFATIDLPGQGILPLLGKPFMKDVQIPLSLLVDYIVKKPEVDKDKLAMFGISGGGEFVPRTAQHDSRIKAIAMNSAVVDAHRLFASMPVADVTPEDMESWSEFKRNTVKVIAWRWGVDMNNIPGLVAANEGYDFDPTQIHVPALSIVGEGEYNSKDVQWQQAEFMEKLACPNHKLIITPAKEGASNHCLLENHSLMSQEVFDFFDDVFKEQ